ncbi:MAG: AbrB/MazE/SpoVT family DNA-binding domain-containing protein [Solirubrobacteraceae bacterium]|jgi:bifunctional DNA-binding transcriptional regulator/antitoxin component of YhaV-PrlF toxin-antitoxin module
MAIARKHATSTEVASARSTGVYVGVQSRGLLALPADVRKRHRLDEPGAQVRVVERDDGVIELHPQLAIPADQAWFWTERWQAMEVEADAEVAAGRVTRHGSGGALLEQLDALRESS